MAWLVEKATGDRRLLEAEHFVGRGLSCALRISQRFVSAQHAVLRWSGERWQVRDLGSRNGTFVDGVRLRAGDELPIRVGSRVAFGKGDDEWLLDDESPPPPMAIPVDGGEPILGDGDLVALPSSDDPRTTIYRNAEGAWMLEQPNESSVPITSMQTFEIDGRVFRFSCPQQILRTSIADEAAAAEVSNIQLRFSVSRDEEHVQLQVACPSGTHDLGARSRHYLLLTLGRRRLSDAAEGLPDTSCGWTYQEELARDPAMAGAQLNIDVFRIRKQFRDLGLIDAANIVERRPRTRQLRIGTGQISIVVL